MDPNTKYLSDSELNLNEIRSHDLEWKRKRNNSAENYLGLDSGLCSRPVTRKFDDAVNSRTAVNSPLSIDAMKLYFLTHLKRESHTRIENETNELTCNMEHSKDVHTNETSISDESSQDVIKNLSSDESKDENSGARSCEKRNIKRHVNLCPDDGKSPKPKNILNESPQNSTESAVVVLDISELSTTEESLSSQNVTINESDSEIPKMVFQTKTLCDREKDCPRKSSIFHKDLCVNLCHESSSSTVDIHQPSTEEIAAVTPDSKYPVQISEGFTYASDLTQMESPFPEKQSIKTPSDKKHEKKISSTKTNEHISSLGNLKEGISSPYQILEDKSALSESIIGQPRCLTLKQHNAYANCLEDEFDFDFEFIDDIDTDAQSLSEQRLETSKNATKICPNPNDMFLDDDSEVQNIPYINLASPLHCVRNREYSILEKEEGELTPELNLSTQTDYGESNPKKSNSKESNLEFFSKVNKCFFQLDKEFNNIRIPRDSKKLVVQLQDTLKIVKRMDRKLSLLIESVFNKGGKKYLRHGRGTTTGSSRNLKGASKNNEYKNILYSNKRINEKVELHKSRSNEQNSRQENNHQDSKVCKSSESTRVNDGKHGTSSKTLENEESQTNYDRNTSRKISASEIRKEKQRIQSLFKRQMNLITRHVVQKNKTTQKQCLKSETPGKSSECKLAHDITSQNIKGPGMPQEPSNLDAVKTLEDMEAFFEMLKEKRHQKSEAKDNVVSYKENHGVLKFTTKKNKHAEWRSFLENAVMETKKKTATPMVQSTKMGDNVSLEKENHFENSKETKENRKIDKEISKSRKELDVEDEQLVKYNSNNPFSATGSEMANLSRSRNSKEQRHVKSTLKRTKVGNAPRDRLVEGIELQNGEELNDSFLVKRNSKEMECIEPISERRVSDFEADSGEITPKNSKRRMTKKRKYSKPKSSESDSQRELKDQIPKKRKRAHSRSKLSSAEAKTDTPSISKSQSRSRYHSEEEIDYFDDRLPSELKPKNLFILADKNLSLLDKHFCLKVRGNQIFLQTKERKPRSNKRELKSSDEETQRKRKRSRKTDKQPRFDPKNVGTTLKEMEDFLQQLRSKKVASEERQDLPSSNLQSKEAKFMARIQAKRKAKLMACISETPTITEKEAKFLKDLEKRAREPCDSPETQRKKERLMQKIRAETDAIVLAQKQCHKKNQNPDEDPLSDVKTILNMIREAESDNDSKQFLVSFPLKRSDVKQLENISAGKTSTLSEESQKFLNNVRAKMRAKKTAVGMEGSDQKQLPKD